MRTQVLSVCILLLSSGGIAQDKQNTAAEPLKPMARIADPAFEVATIKPSDPNHRNNGFHLDGHRVSVENMPVTNLICFAYSIHKSQIVNAPAWFDEVHWDIDGIPDVEGVPSLHQYQRMVEKLLGDRFALQIHHEKRELSVYVLTVAKGGPKLAVSKSDPDDSIDQTGNGKGMMKFTNNSMADFALGMQFIVGKPVVNETNLPGRFDFTLRWSPDELRTSEPDAAPGLYTAIQEELGLKLEPTRAPADVLVIDHAERPSQN